MGVYIAEAQRAKGLLNHSMQSRAALAGQVRRNESESTFDSPRPAQVSQHMSEYDSPEQPAQTQTQPKESQPAVSQLTQIQPSRTQLSQSHTDAWQSQQSAGHSCSPIDSPQSKSWRQQRTEDEPHRDLHGSSAEAFELQGASHQGHYANAERGLLSVPRLNGRDAVHHGSKQQTHAESGHPAEMCDRHESQLQSQVQLSGQPMSHVSRR